jgi:hypothetical protein
MRLSNWNSGIKGRTYRFLDGAISQWMGISGTAVYCHLYLGPYQQETPMLNTDGTTVPAYDAENPSPTNTGNVTSIQDVLFLENRDVAYSPNVFELRGVYNLADLDFDLRQFGLFLQNDTLFIEFHLNDMVDKLGRRLMSGDVLELPHRRDDTLDQNGPAINKFYVVQDASRPAGGYAANWWPYVWRVKVTPMTASQEYSDILNQQQTNPYGFMDPGTIGDLMSTIGTNLGIDDAVVADAKANVPARYFQTQQYWMVLPETTPDNAISVGIPMGGKSNYPWIFAGDGVPPNGALPVNAGNVYPINPVEGEYCLRTDYHPPTLFQWLSGAWRFQEQDWRSSDWSAAHRLLLSFINNDKISTFEDDTTAPEKVALSQAVKPRADF